MTRRPVTALPRTVPPGQLRRTLLAVRQFRTNFLFGTLLLLFVLLLGRLGTLQLVDAAQFRAEAERNQHGAYAFQPRRGRILDRNGRVLATPKPARRVGLDPSVIDDPRTFALVLSDFLGGEPTPWTIGSVLAAAHEEAARAGRPVRQYRVLLPYVDASAIVDRLDDLAAFSGKEQRRMGLYGVVVDMAEGRWYPNGTYAAHVLGQMPREPGAAGTGIEHALDDVLSGEVREVSLRRDGRRRAYAREDGTDHGSAHGRDVMLTLDVTLQHVLETELDALCATWDAEQACGIVLDPVSGEILALANRPTFDPNEQPASANLAIQGLYEPGSFFKPFTVAWALRHAVVEADEVLDMPREILLPLDSKPIHDTHEVGAGTVRRLIAESSNTGAATLAHRLGCERMRALFEHLYPDRVGGTACGLPYEQDGGPRQAHWPWWLAHRAGFGQGFRITPIQMAASFAGFARADGRSVNPTILRVQDAAQVPAARVCDPLHLPVVRAGLEGCVSEGTARRAFEGTPWRVAAKTATAQQWGRKEGRPRQFYNCSVAAYAPAEAPQVVVLVLAQVEASPRAFGGNVAGPHVRRVIERTLAYWRVAAGGEEAAR